MNLKNILLGVCLAIITGCEQADTNTQPQRGTFREVPSYTQEETKKNSEPSGLQRILHGPKTEGAEESDVYQGKFDIRAIVKDTSGYKHSFVNMQATLINIGLDYNRHALTIEHDGIYSICDMKKLVKAERQGGEICVYTKEDKEIRGKIIDSDRLTNFYNDSNNPSINTYLIGISEGKPKKLDIGNLDSIEIENITANVVESTTPIYRFTPPKPAPKEVILKDGRKFESKDAYIIDFCGHWWSSSIHTRLRDSFNNRSLEEITEIEFTGDTNGQERKAILKIKDGTTTEEFLYLTSESYGGTCNTNSRFSYMDKMLLEQDYGCILIPLGDVKTIVPLTEDTQK